MSVPCATACVVEARLLRRGRRIAARRTTLAGPGTAKLALKPKKRLARRAKVTVQATITLADGSATTLRKAVRVSR